MPKKKQKKAIDPSNAQLGGDILGHDMVMQPGDPRLALYANRDSDE